MRGRKPVPTVLRKLHGNPRKVALPKFEPKPAGDLAQIPEWLTEEQKINWSYAMAHSPPGLLKRIDQSALVTWVIAVDLHRQAAMAQASVALLVRVKTKATAGKNDPGVPTASPYLNIINQQAKIILKAASELGFTPVARPRIIAGEVAPTPDFNAGVGAAPRGGKRQMSLEEYLASAPPTPKLN